MKKYRAVVQVVVEVLVDVEAVSGPSWALDTATEEAAIESLTIDVPNRILGQKIISRFTLADKEK